MDDELLESFFQAIANDGRSARSAACKAGKYPELLADWKNRVHKPSLRAFCEVLKANGYVLELKKA